VRRELAERTYFRLCLAFGWLLRSVRYSTTRIVRHDGAPSACKRRGFHAPLAVTLGSRFFRMLDTGVRILPQRNWEEREQRMYQRLYGASIAIDADGTLVLPHLPGVTLATLLVDPCIDKATQKRAIELSVTALAALHRWGFTHGDAMADNVMVDREAGVARWFDFEIVHEPSRPAMWRRADDLRALLTTCLARASRDSLAETLRLMLDAYGDDEVVRHLAMNFGSLPRRALVFHLGQAPLTFESFQTIAGLLSARAAATAAAPAPKEFA